MGCADSKDNNSSSSLKQKCKFLMLENLKALEVIQYLAIQKENISFAIRLLSLRKRAESYYSIINQYRNFWIYHAKKNLNKNTEKYVRCLKEQEREASELKQTRKLVFSIIENLMPGWKALYPSLDELKDFLETSKSVVRQCSSLYSSFYAEDIRKLKIAASEFSSGLQGNDLDLYKKLKFFVVTRYKRPEARVYYSRKIAQLKVKEDSTDRDTYDKKCEIIKNLQSYDGIDLEKFGDEKENSKAFQDNQFSHSKSDQGESISLKFS